MDSVQEITKLYSALESALRTSAKRALRIGELLVAEKARLGHGKWGRFIDRLPFSERSAQRFMSLWRGRERLKSANLTDLTLAAALREAGETIEVSCVRMPDPPADGGAAKQLRIRVERSAATPIRTVSIRRSDALATVQGGGGPASLVAREPLADSLSDLVERLRDDADLSAFENPEVLLDLFEQLGPLVAKWCRRLRR